MTLYTHEVFTLAKSDALAVYRAYLTRVIEKVENLIFESPKTRGTNLKFWVVCLTTHRIVWTVHYLHGRNKFPFEIAANFFPNHILLIQFFFRLE